MFTYNTTLVEIYPSLISRILADYEDNEYWVRLYHQVQANEDLSNNKALFPFVSDCSYELDSDTYILSRPKGPMGPSLKPKEATPYLESSPGVLEDSRLLLPNKTKLLYHINRTISNFRSYIPPAVVPDILQVAHEEGHLGFFRCYKIVTRFWYIQGLTKLLKAFIWNCPQCLQLQTRRHPPYKSLQFIKSPPVPFFTLTLDFMPALPLTKQGFNAIMLMMCKFSKQVTLIEGADTWSAEQ